MTEPVRFTREAAGAWLALAESEVAGAADRLTELDAAIGDGDHGRNLTRGLTAAREKSAASATPRDMLTAAGAALVSAVGGASGPLYGTFLRRMAKTLPEGAEATCEELAAALAAGLAGVRELGGASEGDKTMVDALAPAVAAYTEAIDGGATCGEAARAASRAAREGARGTIPLTARKGRASYLGERSAGHEDPGAASSALIIGALADALEDGDGAAGRAGGDG